jgi:4-alpha-glucanotransferase
MIKLFKRRSSGILLHPSCLPGPYGIGDLGPQAIRFAELLQQAGQSVWQVLPLGPTGYGNSPYQCSSVFAGNPLFISLDYLHEDGLLSNKTLADVPAFNPNRVDYGRVIDHRHALFLKLAENFRHRADASLKADFDAFQQKHDAIWLDDFALFSVLKANYQGQTWTAWDNNLVRCDAATLQQAAETFATAIHNIKLQQFLFYRQWQRLHAHCRRLGIRIFGDAAIFVAHDSVDVWANQKYFLLDDSGQPTVVAGVPQDYFSATGQRWGNPLYDWNALQQNGYNWWRRRLQHTFDEFDLVRLDHFRGFQAHWAIPAADTTAEHGSWQPGPGLAFFDAMKTHFPDMPIVAEDLGFITPDVEALRDACGFPGMRILQFAFGSDAMADSFLPENYVPNCVCYTGTHDNDTILGAFDIHNTSPTRDQQTIRAERDRALAYLHSDGTELHWDFIAAAARSVAAMVIFPLQDVLGLGTESRMNTPGTLTGNWCWRCPANMLPEEVGQRLLQLTVETSRSGRGTAIMNESHTGNSFP